MTSAVGGGRGVPKKQTKAEEGGGGSSQIRHHFKEWKIKQINRFKASKLGRSIAIKIQDNCGDK